MVPPLLNSIIEMLPHLPMIRRWRTPQFCKLRLAFSVLIRAGARNVEKVQEGGPWRVQWLCVGMKHTGLDGYILVKDEILRFVNLFWIPAY